VDKTALTVSGNHNTLTTDSISTMGKDGQIMDTMVCTLHTNTKTRLQSSV